MFELMESSGEASDKALEFIREEVPEMAITVSELHNMLPYKDRYPCLMDFYITYHLNRNRVRLPSLSYHLCGKITAKCLIYYKTNKLTGRRHRWRLIEVGTTLVDFQKIQLEYSNRPIIESDGAQPALLECLRNREPFLLHTLMMHGSHGENQIHQSIVTLELAKVLVYYKKNLSLMNKLNIDDVFSILNDFGAKNPEIKSMWDSKVMLEIRKKINEENEILY